MDVHAERVRKSHFRNGRADALPLRGAVWMCAALMKSSRCGPSGRRRRSLQPLQQRPTEVVAMIIDSPPIKDCSYRGTRKPGRVTPVRTFWVPAFDRCVCVCACV